MPNLTSSPTKRIFLTSNPSEECLEDLKRLLVIPYYYDDKANIELYLAVAKKDVQATKKCLDEGFANPNCFNGVLFRMAVRNGSDDILKILVTKNKSLLSTPPKEFKSTVYAVSPILGAALGVLAIANPLGALAGALLLGPCFALVLTKNRIKAFEAYKSKKDQVNVSAQEQYYYNLGKNSHKSLWRTLSNYFNPKAIYYRDAYAAGEESVNINRSVALSKRYLQTGEEHLDITRVSCFTVQLDALKNSSDEASIDEKPSCRYPLRNRMRQASV